MWPNQWDQHNLCFLFFFLSRSNEINNFLNMDIWLIYVVIFDHTQQRKYHSNHFSNVKFNCVFLISFYHYYYYCYQFDSIWIDNFFCFEPIIRSGFVSLIVCFDQDSHSIRMHHKNCPFWCKELSYLCFVEWLAFVLFIHCKMCAHK